MKKLAINKSILLIVVLALLAIVGISGLLITVAGDGGNTTSLQSQNGKRNGQQDYTASQANSKAVQSDLADDYDTIEGLQYLIEEEKLAHDVYVYFYDKYGTKIFNNIGASETTHQERVLGLLNSRDIPDPRLEAAGKFTNQELQSLYNQLIAQGEQSLTEAYKVGVAIEEKDIADLQAQIDSTTDSEIIAVLSSLRNASENHLRAFNRQL